MGDSDQYFGEWGYGVIDFDHKSYSVDESSGCLIDWDETIIHWDLVYNFVMGLYSYITSAIKKIDLLN